MQIENKMYIFDPEIVGATDWTIMRQKFAQWLKDSAYSRHYFCLESESLNAIFIRIFVHDSLLKM